MKLFLIFLRLIAIIIVSPFITIWALNLLFGLAIPYNLATWAAALWVTSLVANNSSSSKGN
jgi:hypothetical protein